MRIGCLTIGKSEQQVQAARRPQPAQMRKPATSLGNPAAEQHSGVVLPAQLLGAAAVQL